METFSGVEMCKYIQKNDHYLIDCFSQCDDSVTTYILFIVDLSQCQFLLYLFMFDSDEHTLNNTIKGFTTI